MILFLMLACKGGHTTYEVENLVSVQVPVGGECEEMEIEGGENPQPAALVILGVWPGETGKEVICGTDTAVFAAGRLDPVSGPGAKTRLNASQDLYTAAFDAVAVALPTPGSIKGCETVGETQDFSVVGSLYKRTLWLCQDTDSLYFVGYSSKTESYDNKAAAAWLNNVHFTL